MSTPQLGVAAVPSGGPAMSAGSGAGEPSEAHYKGVRKRKWGKWVAEVRLPNSRERIWLGSYSTAEEAARAYDAAVFCLRGPGAKFNLPGPPPSIPFAETLSRVQIREAAARYARESGHGETQPCPTPTGELTETAWAGMDEQMAAFWPEVSGEYHWGAFSEVYPWEVLQEGLHPAHEGFFPVAWVGRGDAGQVYNDEDDGDGVGHGGGNVLWFF